MTSAPHPIVAVVGATATGKSELGLKLAEALGGEVVNADASQLYRGMDIGTAKVPVPERRGIPHHQLDVIDIIDEASVAAYQRSSRADIDAIQHRGATPILVGGSGLYVRAALDVLEIPPTDEAVRAAYEQRLESEGLALLFEELRSKDPDAATQILPTNGRRIVRALEVIELTGRPFSATMPRREFVQPAVMIGLHAATATLDERIARRTHQMWEAGLLEEVTALERIGLRDGRTASRAIGYQQALAQLDGELTRDQAIEQTTAATRRLARRQASWFRPDKRIAWLEHDDPALLERALHAIRECECTRTDGGGWVT